ncbi:hypothetical protein T492DRAFT_856741 [Pavlovales sp. CCMP2436]|nr:hypothetical protein T492DRAFT_856741 [Pavlovales sp. CCMP2436]
MSDVDQVEETADPAPSPPPLRGKYAHFRGGLKAGGSARKSPARKKPLPQPKPKGSGRGGGKGKGRGKGRRRGGFGGFRGRGRGSLFNQSFHRAPALRAAPCTRKRRLQRFVFGFLIIHHFYQFPTSA